MTDPSSSHPTPASNARAMQVAVFGLGKLGLPLVAVAASKGHSVIGVDCNPSTISCLHRGEVPVQEPDLSELLSQYTAYIQYTRDGTTASKNSELILVVVPTPSLPGGDFSTEYVCNAARHIGEGIRQSTEYKVVALVSTVMPGATQREFIHALEWTSAKRCGEAFGVCYNPEFIALGSVIRDTLHPDFVLIGESDPQAGDLLSQFHRTLHNSPIARMSIPSAEVTKLAVNCYVTTKISFANSIAELCSHIPGTDVNHITQAMGLDHRIGPAYLRAGTAYGGPCFPRDGRAYRRAAKEVGVQAFLSEATDQVNQHMAEKLVRLLTQYLPRPGLVALLGLAYKPGTPVVEESASLLLLPHLLNCGYQVLGWDPLLGSLAREKFHPDMLANSLEECVRDASAILVMTPDDRSFRKLPPHHATVVIDPWGVVDPSCQSLTQYIQPGVTHA